MKHSCNNLFSTLEPQRLNSNFDGKHAWPSGTRLPLTAGPRGEFLIREQIRFYLSLSPAYKNENHYLFQNNIPVNIVQSTKLLYYKGLEYKYALH